MRMHFFLWAGFGLLAGAATGCGGPELIAPEVRVAAASDLQPVFSPLAQAFRSRTGYRVEFVAGASGQLAEQIRQGAPFDVFLSADRAFVQKLADAGIVQGESMRPYALGRLAIASRNDLGGGPLIAKLSDLTRPEVRNVAIANPDTAPYGRAARQALERAGSGRACGRRSSRRARSARPSSTFKKATPRPGW